MLLLVVDDDKAFAQKEKYIEVLFSGDILHVNSIYEAEELVKEKESVDFLIINNIIVETNFEITELKKLNDSFCGSIVLKVTDERLGISLIKKGVIADYFLADSNQEVEIGNLKRALKTTSIKQRVGRKLCNITEGIQLMNKITTR